MNSVHRKLEPQILLPPMEKTVENRILRWKRRKSGGERTSLRGLVDVHVQVPLVVQVATNSLTEHLHVTLISRHSLLLAVLEQLLT